MTTWRKELTRTMESTKETLKDIKVNTMTEEEMDVEFDRGFGGTNGIPFTIWTKNYVYFPAKYDGSEWVACIKRNPGKNPKATNHIGHG